MESPYILYSYDKKESGKRWLKKKKIDEDVIKTTEKRKNVLFKNLKPRDPMNPSIMTAGVKRREDFFISFKSIFLKNQEVKTVN